MKAKDASPSLTLERTGKKAMGGVKKVRRRRTICGDATQSLFANLN
jgi:hypothetical protein